MGITEEKKISTVIEGGNKTWGGAIFPKESRLFKIPEYFANVAVCYYISVNLFLLLPSTEKSQKLSLDNITVGSFADVKALYNREKDSILKSAPLTSSAVMPSKLQLQNVQHVLSVFNDRVIAALKFQGSHETADFIQQILNWWNTMNVSSTFQATRMRDPWRSTQDKTSTSLQYFADMFQALDSGHGPTRVQCLTHDTKRALMQTTHGLISVCAYLIEAGFEYVLLREIQSDRIEGEFSVYRQSTGANAFMLAGDVMSAFKKRLVRFSASFLEFVELDIPPQPHTCRDIDYNIACAIESCMNDVTLTPTEECAAAYVAGWLEKKCVDVIFSEEQELLDSEGVYFISEVSKGYLTIPHRCTYEFVSAGLCLLKKLKHDICCRTRLSDILSSMNEFFDFGFTSKHLFRRISNVLLHGIQNLEKDHQKNTTLYQTSIKKARLAD